MGAHPSAPSRVWRGGGWRSLLEVIAERPEQELGHAVHTRFGPRLPFLFKVLAAATPLSLQAHPSAAQAVAGFEAEERAGIALQAPERNYKDRSHKPELVCALSTFHALTGFRDVAATLRLFDMLGVDSLKRAARVLAQEPPQIALRHLFSWLLSQRGPPRHELIASTLAACEKARDRGGAFADECEWAVRIGALYPDDVGVVVALLLNLVRLLPGEALYLPAGQLHAYLGGVAVEIMANSDNVLRAGLTPKHVDVPELLAILEFTDGEIAPVRPQTSGAEHIYVTPTPEFRLSRIELGGGAIFRTERRWGPEILLCAEGEALAHDGSGGPLPLARGQSVFVAAEQAIYELSGTGTVFRATTHPNP